MNSIQKFEMMLDNLDNQLMEANKKGIPFTVGGKKKYPNGYLPKIQYWQGKCSQYLNAGDVSNYYVALGKVKYFQRKNGMV
jgi:hypothetical protein